VGSLDVIEPMVIAVAAAVAAGVPAGDEGNDAPVELGQVRWQRDLDAALAESGGSGRPLFVLFQEVPG